MKLKFRAYASINICTTEQKFQLMQARIDILIRFLIPFTLSLFHEIILLDSIISRLGSHGIIKKIIDYWCAKLALNGVTLILPRGNSLILPTKNLTAWVSIQPVHEF